MVQVDGARLPLPLPPDPRPQLLHHRRHRPSASELYQLQQLAQHPLSHLELPRLLRRRHRRLAGLRSVALAVLLQRLLLRRSASGLPLRLQRQQHPLQHLQRLRSLSARLLVEQRQDLHLQLLLSADSVLLLAPDQRLRLLRFRLVRQPRPEELPLLRPHLAGLEPHSALALQHLQHHQHLVGSVVSVVDLERLQALRAVARLRSVTLELVSPVVSALAPYLAQRQPAVPAGWRRRRRLRSGKCGPVCGPLALQRRASVCIMI